MIYKDFKGLKLSGVAKGFRSLILKLNLGLVTPIAIGLVLYSHFKSYNIKFTTKINFDVEKTNGKKARDSEKPRV